MIVPPAGECTADISMAWGGRAAIKETKILEPFGDIRRYQKSGLLHSMVTICNDDVLYIVFFKNIMDI